MCPESRDRKVLIGVPHSLLLILDLLRHSERATDQLAIIPQLDLLEGRDGTGAFSLGERLPALKQITSLDHPGRRQLQRPRVGQRERNRPHH